MAGVNLHGYVIAALFRAPNFETQKEPCPEVPSNTSSNGSYVVCKPDDNPSIEMEIEERSQVLKIEVDRNGETEKQYPDITDVEKITSTKNIGCKTDNNPSRCKKICDVLGGIVAISLFKMPAFSLFCLAIFLGSSGNIVPFNFVPLRVSAMGISKQSTAMLIMYFGFGSAVGRILAGWVGDQPWANRTLMYACSHSLAGCISFIAYFISNYNALIAYCALFAIASGKEPPNLDLVGWLTILALNYFVKI